MARRHTSIRLAAIAAAAALALSACGGTTGREGLEPLKLAADGGDATVTAEAGDDLDAGAFDVAIFFIDRPLPDVSGQVQPSTEAGTDADWPSCAPFIPVSADGHPVALGSEFTQIPAVYDDAGKELAASDGSDCATHPWLGSTRIDECVAENSSGFVELPPCNWAADAGLAVEGPGAGESRYTLCRALFDCIMRTGCGVLDVGTCLCGADTNSLDCAKNPAGPCMHEEMAALELPVSSISDALKNYEHASTEFPGFGGAFLNTVFQNGESPYQQTSSCFAPDVQDASVRDSTVADAAPAGTGAPESGVPEAGARDADASVDVEDGGSEEGASGEAGETDAPTPDAEPPDSTVRDAGPPDAGARDSAPDVGSRDGASGDGSPGATDGGGASPKICTAAGQTRCVRCSGNADGTCTPTEAAFVQHDLDAGRDPNFSDPLNSANSSCYACLFAAGCIDDTTFADTGHECGDLSGDFGAGAQAGTPSSTLCISTLSCVLATSCAEADISICYCGANYPGNACQTASPADGVCYRQEVDGLGLSDNPTVLKDYTDLTRPSGVANQIFSCAETNGCTACLK